MYLEGVADRTAAEGLRRRELTIDVGTGVPWATTSSGPRTSSGGPPPPRRHRARARSPTSCWAPPRTGWWSPRRPATWSRSRSSPPWSPRSRPPRSPSTAGRAVPESRSKSRDGGDTRGSSPAERLAASLTRRGRRPHRHRRLRPDRRRGDPRRAVAGSQGAGGGSGAGARHRAGPRRWPPPRWSASTPSPSSTRRHSPRSPSHRDRRRGVADDRFVATATAAVLADRTELPSPEPVASPSRPPSPTGCTCFHLDLPSRGPTCSSSASTTASPRRRSAWPAPAPGSWWPSEGPPWRSSPGWRPASCCRLEAERRLTILWGATPVAIEDLGGFPMVDFGDRRTPTLQFDHVVYRIPPGHSGALTRRGGVGGPPSSPSVRLRSRARRCTCRRGRRGTSSAASGSPTFPSRCPHAPLAGTDEAIEALRAQHYNATITRFDRTHSDLWLLRVRPDRGDTRTWPGSTPRWGWATGSRGRTWPASPTSTRSGTS